MEFIIFLSVIALFWVLGWLISSEPDLSDLPKEKPRYIITVQNVYITLFDGRKIKRQVRTHNEPFKTGLGWHTYLITPISRVVNNYCARITKEGFQSNDCWILPKNIKNIQLGEITAWETSGDLTWEPEKKE
jgi:hypothetical protein